MGERHEEKIEFWKPIRGFENYEVSSLGRVRNLNFNRSGSVRLMRQQKSRGDYLFVSLCKRSKYSQMRVNRLVLLTFVGEPPPGTQDAAHLNGINNDNRLVNLRWCSRQENSDHKYVHKTSSNHTKPNAKLSWNDVNQIRREFKRVNSRNSNIKNLGIKFGVSSETIGRIVNRKIWDEQSAD